MGAALLASLLAGLATSVGALPFVLSHGVSRRTYDTLLGVGAGLMLSASTLGLLGHALEQVRDARGLHIPQLFAVLLGFLCGVGLMWALDRLVPHVHAAGHPDHATEKDDSTRQGLLMTGGVVLHRIPEGFAIGSAFVHGGALGTLLTCAIAVQNICEGVVLSAPLRRGGLSGGKLLAVATATGLALPLAAAAGVVVGTHTTGTLPFLLALAAGALIYLVSNEVIPESHSHGNEALATLGLAGGFLATVVIQAATGPHP